MAKKKASVKTPPLPTEFKVADILDVEEEASLKEVPTHVAHEIAEEVDASTPSVLLKMKQNESELRDRFEEAYLQEIERRQECAWEHCSHKMTTLVGAIAHFRWHMMNQEFDPKLARAVILDVEHQQYPQIEKSLEAILGPDDRKKVLADMEKDRKERLKLTE